MKCLDILQKINNLLYQIFGNRKFIIDFQVFINKKRFESNDTDETEVITDEGFVQ